MTFWPPQVERAGWTGDQVWVGVDLLKADGSELRELSRRQVSKSYQEGRARILGWSSDASALLVLSGNEQGELLRLDVRSGEAYNLTDRVVATGFYHGADLSPDGTKVAFVSPEAAAEECPYPYGLPTSLWMVNVEGGDLTRLVEPTCNLGVVSWSPDGARLAYTIVGHPQGGSNGAYVVNLATRALTRLTRPAEGFDVKVDWTPDGSHILVQRRPCIGCDVPGYGQAVLVPAVGGEEELLATAWAFGGFAPDGRHYAYASEPEGLSLASMDLHEKLTLVESDPRFEFVNVIWSPDGQRLAFVRQQTCGFHRYAVRVDGSDLAELPLLLEGGVLSPDGRKLAFARMADGEQVALWVADADGTSERQLVDMPAYYRVAWAPDSQRIAFLTYTGGKAYVVGIDGTGLTELATDVKEDSLAWSPDGSQLAYISVGHVWVRQLGSSEARPLASGDSYLEWSPDGDRLLFSAGADLFVLEVAAGKIVTLARSSAPLSQPARCGQTQSARWSWSPDGQRVAFSREDGLYVVPVDGGAPEKLFQWGCGHGKPVWSPDGQQLAVVAVDQPEPGIYIVNSDGSDSARLVSGYTAADDIAWSDDGQELFFTLLFACL